MAGHIQDRGNGSYLLVYHVGYDSKGKRIRKTKTVRSKNKTEARKELAAFVTEIDVGEYVAPSYTLLSNYIKIWRNEALKRLAPSTIESYDYVLNARIIPILGYFKLEDIKPIHISNYIDDLEKEGLSSSSMIKNFNIINSIFNLAVKNDVLKSNPVDKVDRPSVTYKEGQVYDSDELKQLHLLLNEQDNKQMVTIIKLALLTGMRKGEILALQWEDVDFSTNTIHVRNSLSYTKQHGYQLKEPKTKGSNRKVAPPAKFMEVLKKHIYKKKTDRMETSELWEGGKYQFVFSSDFGKPLFPDVPNKWWCRFLKRVNKQLKDEGKPLLKKIRFHDLRHCAATDLINKGANIYSISKRLGHANINTTMNIYGHYLEEADQKIADMLDEDYI